MAIYVEIFNTVMNLVMAGSHELGDLLGFSVETKECQMLIFSHFYSYTDICRGAILNASVFRVSIHTYQSAEVQAWRLLCSEFPFTHISICRGAKLEGVCVQSFHSHITICWGVSMNVFVVRVPVHTHVNLPRCKTWRRLSSEFPFTHINLLRWKVVGVCVQSFHLLYIFCVQF